MFFSHIELSNFLDRGTGLKCLRFTSGAKLVGRRFKSNFQLPMEVAYHPATQRLETTTIGFLTPRCPWTGPSWPGLRSLAALVYKNFPGPLLCSHAWCLSLVL